MRLLTIPSSVPLPLFTIVLFVAVSGCSSPAFRPAVDPHGAIVRGDEESRDLALVFTGDEFADGADHIRQVLGARDIVASFFLTGNFYRTSAFADAITALVEAGHYMGAHSDRHLLYCSWEDRDSTLVTREQFETDVRDNYAEMVRFGIEWEDAPYFLPPYEWYNRQIAAWTEDAGLRLVNYTPGTRSHADYTTPDMGDRYVSSDDILQSIWNYESQEPNDLNGFILLMHIGTAPQRADKLYLRLDELLDSLSAKGYRFRRIDGLLGR